MRLVGNPHRVVAYNRETKLSLIVLDNVFTNTIVYL